MKLLKRGVKPPVTKGHAMGHEDCVWGPKNSSGAALFLGPPRHGKEVCPYAVYVPFPAGESLSGLRRHGMKALISSIGKVARGVLTRGADWLVQGMDHALKQ